MGCSNSQSVIKVVKNNTKTMSETRRSSSILFEYFSKHSDYKKKYEYVAMIGNGAFGKVRLYRDRTCSRIQNAIKTIKKNFINQHSIDSIMREVDILRQLDHPNIVKYFETYEDNYYLHIVMEYIPGDNLFKMITNKQFFNFTEKDIGQIVSCLLKAVLFLHNQGIVHRDIKPDNILFSVPGNYLSLKLIDFGLSIPKNAKKEKYRVGTPYYMAPEMIEGKYFYESDMWSIGVILYVMVTGHQPFRGKDQSNVFERIQQGFYDRKLLERQKCSKELKDLIKKALVVDPKKRISVDSALNHPWFTLFEKDKENNKIEPEIIEALRDFRNRDLLQKEVLYYLAKLSTELEVQKLKEAFSIIDKDNSGEIEYNEILRIFNQLGIEATEEELKQIFDSLDFHNDGKVNYSEFLAGTMSSLKYQKEERLWSAFKYFDTTDSGYITVDTVIAALKQSNVVVDVSGLNQTFDELQKKDKKINFEEFKKIFYSRKSSTAIN